MALDIKKASDGAKKNIKMLIYGKSGTKKTRFSTGFLEGALVLDFEGGLGSALNPDRPGKHLANGRYCLAAGPHSPVDAQPCP